MLFTSKFFERELVEADAKSKYLGDLLRNLLISVALFVAASKVMDVPSADTFVLPKWAVWLVLVILAADLVWRSSLGVALRVDHYIWRKTSAPTDGWGLFGRFIPFFLVLLVICAVVIEAVFLLTKFNVAGLSR